jgi:hypothetical protein
MAKLTEHFTDRELGVDDTELRVLENATFLCAEILEPIRTRFGAVRINSGYRDPGDNDRVGGKATSFHLFGGGTAAADVVATAVPVTELFDWLRLESGLPFDKVILESNASQVPVVVHIQVDRLKPPRRLAYTGSTGAGTKYVPVEVR